MSAGMPSTGSKPSIRTLLGDLPVTVDAHHGVVEDAHQPGAKVGAFGEAVGIFQRLHERVLDHVLGKVKVAVAEFERGALQSLPVGLDQVFKAGFHGTLAYLPIS